MMNSNDFLKYLNLALKENGLDEKKQDEIYFNTKELLDRHTVDEIQEKLNQWYENH